MRATRLALVAVAAVSLLAAGCGGNSGGSHHGGIGAGGFTPPNIPALQSLGQGEGQVNLVSWAGYVEDGSNYKDRDWVHPFEKQTGCKVHNTVAGTSDEMVSLMKSGQYDAVSASGDASLRLIAGGTVAPVNTSLVPNYADIFPDLKNKPWNSVNGKMYGIPHGRGANMLMWRTDKVNPAPDSWSVVFDPNSPYKGKITAYDSPIYIADAALYLMSTQPALEIKDPYALDQRQFDAAVNLLKEQKQIVGEYWSDATKIQQSFKAGDTVLGTTWQVIANGLSADKTPVQTVLPKEGATGWSDTWMVAAKAQHPNCAYKWLNWVVSPQVNAQIAESWGEAPANSKACDLTQDKNFCTTYHAADAPYWTKVHYWNTPITQCLDGRKDVKCVDYAKWTQAWTQIKG
ncbi:ABC transporter substrate-binding protein [Actinoallomurus rhizosphaericola]|uniref:ABC transporter substrate-binding protein n=1 Tax=Actinoallomurus rhizosphaericola TaxID=2952536 RepID=UPI00209068EA|nr:ABC transporter substrate-binding protein [Actinoallomurus rhizosphaericola]MCO5993269.1 ABC transporter substrate-binding protein [Actinoallomurus rhizosphaericola]